MPEYRPENLLMLIFYSKENVNSVKSATHGKKGGRYNPEISCSHILENYNFE